MDDDVALRIVLCIRTPVNADHRVVLDEQVVGLRSRDTPAREADNQDSSLPRNHLGAPVVGVAADRVVDDVYSPRVGELLDLVDEVASAVVNRKVRAEPFANCDLVRSACRRDHGATVRFRELDCRTADAPRTRMHQHGLAGLQIRPTMQRNVSRVIGDPKCGGNVEGHVANRGKSVRRAQRVLGQTTVHHVRLPEDTVAGLVCRDTRPNLVDDARHLHAGRERQRWLLLVATSTQEHVWKVQRR